MSSLKKLQQCVQKQLMTHDMRMSRVDVALGLHVELIVEEHGILNKKGIRDDHYNTLFSFYNLRIGLMNNKNNYIIKD